MNVTLPAATDIAFSGFVAQATSTTTRIPCPFLYSSDNWLLFQAGAWLSRKGLPKPREAKKSRGYRVIVDGRTLSLVDDGTDLGAAFQITDIKGH
jgi:hypothetical protein